MDKSIIRFAHIAKQIVNTPNYQLMKTHNHHGNVSTYRHSLEVAYMSYLKYLEKGITKYSETEIIRGALLHDYYLYDWHNTGEGHRLHGFRHPYFALRNAKRDFGPLTKGEIDIIKHHMFPLVPIHPKTKIGLIVSICDKRAANNNYRQEQK